MDIQPIRQTSFKGYDARPLKGFLMSTNKDGIASAMQKIGEKEGFKIYTAVKYDRIFEGVTNDLNNVDYPWAQDYWTFYKNRLQTKEFNSTFKSILDFFKLKEDFTEKIIFDNNRRIFKEKIKKNRIKTDKAIKRQDNKKITDCHKEGKELTEKARQTTFHIAGGNLFIVNGNNNKNEIIIGKDVLELYNIEELKGMYDVENVIVLPQMDFHLDLFIRPLDKKRILLADDNLTLEILKNNLQKIKDYTLKLLYRETRKEWELNNIAAEYEKAIDYFTKQKNLNKSAQTKEVETILKENGYEVIRVPGRIYEIEIFLGSKKQNLRHLCNYMNANTFINNNGDLVYITNSSNFDSTLGITSELAKEIGCSFEEAFINSISPYIKRDHIYFIKGNNNYLEKELLHSYGGGIHCTCAEIPLDIEQKNVNTSPTCLTL